MRDDAVAELEADHARVLRLLRALAGSREAEERERLFALAEEELTVHGRLEAELFDPAYEAAALGQDARFLDQAQAEHAGLDCLLGSMRSQDRASAPFAAQARLLRDQFRQHVQSEEGRLFPAARRLLPAPELEALGARLRRRRDELLGLDDRSGGSVWRNFLQATDWGHVRPVA